MKITKFQDNSSNHIQISFASDGDIRIYISESDKTEENKACLKLSKAQAQLLIAAIIDMDGDE